MTVPPFRTQLARGHVLLVEEASVMRELQVLFLNTAGYEVAVADAPAHAVSHAQGNRTDVVVLNCDGAAAHEASFFAALHHAQPTAIIVVMASLLTSDAVRDLKRLGVSSVVDRTLNPGLFVELLDGVLGLTAQPAPSNFVDSLLDLPDSAERSVAASESAVRTHGSAPSVL